MISDESDGRAASPIVGNILLVAVVLIVGSIVAVVGLTFLDGYGTPTADASFEIEQSPAGLVLQPRALGTDVVIKLDGTEIERIDSDNAGQTVLVPTVPGSEIVVVSQDEANSVLLREEVDSREELGDFTAYYTFERGENPDVLADSSGNGNEGTLEDDNGGNGPQWGGCGLQFDGNDDYVDITNISAPEDVTEFTVAVKYVQTGNTGSKSVNQLIEHQFGSGQEWFFELSGQIDESYTSSYSIDYAVEYANQVASSSAVSTNTTHVVVGTYDGSSYDLYVDGERVDGGTHSEAVGMGDMHLGRDFENPSQYLDGEICELRLYYTAFDSGQIERITTAMEP
ncbi:LamG domain-containing protein [Halovenus salina]|uniref:LamG domain-containing protein n=1 Tax=Halovenus salina TaxID=1510225 RepID=A0ABD5W3D9_9EURY|nr:LamG domain-containing protein [Halovenus salina]